MFELCVSVTPQLRGLKALDERRRLGLSDGTVLGKCQETNSEAYSFLVEVSEAFAREFPDVFDEYNDMEIDVPTSSFKKGELIIDPNDKNSVKPGPALTEDRLLELAKVFMATPVKE